MAKKINKKDFCTQVERSKSFSLYLYGFSVAQTLIFHTSEFIQSIFDVEMSKRLSQVFDTIKISIVIENAKTLVKLFVTIVLSPIYISYVLKFLIRIISLFEHGETELIWTSRLKNRLTQPIYSLPPVNMTYSPIIGSFLTLGYYDPDTLGDWDASTLGDMDYTLA